MASVKIDIQGVEYAYGNLHALNGIDLTFRAGDFAGIIGPNGSGKSTLLKSISRVLPDIGGRVFLDGKDMRQLSRMAIARQLAAVGQETRTDFAFTVAEIVALGRLPHQGRWGAETEGDRAAVRRAMTLTGVESLADRTVDALSEGEKQRVLLAQALAQEPSVLFLDEPTAHLDIGYQAEMMGLISDLNRDLHLTVVAVLHDLNLAAQYCRRLILLKQGLVFAAGTAEQVLTAENIRAVYGSEVLIAEHPTGRHPVVMLQTKQREAEPPVVQRERRRIHLICGGGTGAALMQALVSGGHTVTAGVLNLGDSDWQKAGELGVACVEEAPFSPITEQKRQENLARCLAADLVIVTDFPVGIGNLPNIFVLSEVAAHKLPVLLFEPDGLPRRDYTGGTAAACWAQIMSRASVHSVPGRPSLPAVAAVLAEIKQ